MATFKHLGLFQPINYICIITFLPNSLRAFFYSEIMWWGKLDHRLVSWHFPVYIEPSALLLLVITTYQNTFFPFFLLTAFLLIN